MKKQFAIKSVKAIKNVKNLVAKSEATNILNFSILSECCPAKPGVDDVSAVAVFSL